MLYNNYLVTLSDKFTRRLDDIWADYNFDNGDEFEVAICEVLRDFLPSKYGIVRGFVVSKDGHKKGDDIIIYDQELFPTLKLHNREDYSRKENIPIEAIFAYIEAKHNLTEDTLDKAIKQVTEIKELCSKRDKMGLEQHDPYIPPKEKPALYSKTYPDFRNPIFTMILSRYSTNSEGSREANNIESMIDKKLDEIVNQKVGFLPELIVAGPDVYGSIALEDNGISPTVFFLPEKKHLYYTGQGKGLSFGVALVHLFTALDWIRLQKFPWIELLNDGLIATTKK